MDSCPATELANTAAATIAVDVDHAPATVPLHQLFRHAAPLDKALMAVGSVCAVGGGLVWPGFYLVLGTMLDAFVFATSLEQLEADVFDNCMKLLGVGVGGFGF